MLKIPMINEASNPNDQTVSRQEAHSKVREFLAWGEARGHASRCLRMSHSVSQRPITFACDGCGGFDKLTTGGFDKLHRRLFDCQ
jgi:hypothetical protein